MNVTIKPPAIVEDKPWKNRLSVIPSITLKRASLNPAQAQKIKHTKTGIILNYLCCQNYLILNLV